MNKATADLHNVRLVPEGGVLIAMGIINNDQAMRFDNDTFIRTSFIVKINVEEQTIETNNTIYRIKN